MRVLLPTFALFTVIAATDFEAQTEPNHNNFDLFKNTGFTPCPANAQTTADAFTNDFAISHWVTTQDQVCSYLAGTPIFVIYLAAQVHSTSPQYTYIPTPQGLEFQKPDHPEHKFQPTTEIQSLPVSQSKAWNGIPTRWKVLLISSLLATLLLFAFSFAIMIKHWQFRWTSPATALNKQVYVPMPEAISNPASVLGQLPDACLAYLTSGALKKAEFFRKDSEQKVFAIITTLQYVFSLFSLSAIFLGKKNAFSRSYRVLITSAIITGLGLLIPAFAAGMLIVKEKGAILRFTNNLGVTGGYTFAFLAIKRQVGYWDVPYELGFRIAMSFFGAA